MPNPAIQGIVSLKEPVRMAFDSMRAHKLRTFLTLLGIILSVSTLIFVISMIEGTNRYIADRVANMGANVFLVNRFGIIPDRKAFLAALKRNKPISYEDYEYLRDNMQLAGKVGIEGRRFGTIKYNEENFTDVNIRGVSASIGDMDVEEPEIGRYVTDGDDNRRLQVALIGAEVAKRFFTGQDPIGKTIAIDGRPFEVVGVAKAIGNVMGQNQDIFVYIPVQTYIKIYGANQDGFAVNVQARSADVSDAAQDEARSLMRARRHLTPSQPDSFGIVGASTLMDLWKQLTGTLAASMVGIVSVFMVIGGVVIMNVMLTAVTERTREVGIRKSLGAKQKDILLQFLAESGMMAAFGGAIGVLFAGTMAYVLDATTPLPMKLPMWAVIVALTVSTVVGLFFGIYPARKAARLDPIEAIRHEN